MFDISLKYFRTLNYLLAALTLITSLLLIRTIINISFSDTKPSSSAAPETQARALSGKKNIMHYSGILEENPFGPSLELRPLSVTEKTEAKDTPISNLILVGTAVGSEDRSYAIFMDKAGSSGKSQEIFSYGDSVFNYGVLKKIENTSVEIERDSSSYKIMIPFDEIKTEQENSELQNSRPDISRRDTSKKSFAKRIGDRKYILDSRKVQQSLENPERLLTDARLLPVIKDGKQEGFIISEVVPDGMYHSLGLRNGDTLLKINGLEISNPEVAIQAMSALKGMNSIELDIIRDGTRMSLDYQIR